MFGCQQTEQSPIVRVSQNGCGPVEAETKIRDSGDSGNIAAQTGFYSLNVVGLSSNACPGQGKPLECRNRGTEGPPMA